MLSLHEEDIRIAAHDLSEICKISAHIMLIPLVFTLISLQNFEPAYLAVKFSAFLAPAALLYLLYRLMRKYRSEAPPRTKHMMITVSLAWLVIALAGSLPYMVNGTLEPLDAFFESMSGWTTTGMTMIEKPEAVAMDVLFYRAFTQWVGGVGIIVLALVVFLRKGTFAMDYYASEVGEQRIKPRLKSTIAETWKIYAVYTLACIILLYISGADLFDAVAHSFSALSTGGFSTHAENVGYYNTQPNGLLIHAILLVFMVIGAVSFLVHFKLFEGQYKKIPQNIEMRYMFWIMFFATLLVFSSLWMRAPQNPLQTFMDSLFQVVAAMTCTGFSTVDTSVWPDMPQTVIMILMYIGGLYGSTAGGIKILRLVLIVQVITHSMKKLMLPKTAVLRMKIGGKQVDGGEIIYVFALVTAYLSVSLLGAGILMTSFTEVQSMSLSLSAMGNVGLTAVSGEAWFHMTPWNKLTLAALMWVGRLEVFPVLVLLTSATHLVRLKRTARE